MRLFAFESASHLLQIHPRQADPPEDAKRLRMEEKLTSDQGASRSGGGTDKQEQAIMTKFFKRMLTAYILSAGAYRHPMMWPH